MSDERGPVVDGSAYEQAVRDAAADGLACEVCNGESGPAIGVAGSSLGPISFAYCRPCLLAHAEPMGMLRSVVLWECGGLENCAEWVQSLTTWHEGRYITVQELPPLTDEEIGRYQKIDDEYLAKDWGESGMDEITFGEP